MSSNIRLLAIGSDLHCGSTAGLLHPDFVTKEGNHIEQNLLQQWLWKCWLEGHDWLARKVGRDPYAMIWNGDLEEGVHHGGAQIVSNQAQDHTTAATLVLTSPPVAKPTKVFIVKGTECHTRDNEEFIAERIGAEKDPNTGKRCRDILNFSMCGVRISARHHFPATSRAYLEASQHSIQMGNAIVEASRIGRTPPRILIGAHRHRSGHFCDGHSLTVVTGPWQGLTRHGFKVVPDGQPNPGFYLLDWRNKQDGDLPEVHFITFVMPEGQVETI